MLITPPGAVDSVCSSICPIKLNAKTQCNSVYNHSFTISHPQLCFLSRIVSVGSIFRNGGTCQLFLQQPLVHLNGAGLIASAVKKQRQGSGGVRMEEMDSVEEEDDKSDVDVDVDLDAEGSDDESEVLPFEQMKTWLRSKPKGFGEGKVYDTSVEDKMLEEMEQSRLAQVANLNKLKSRPSNLGTAKDVQSKQARPVFASGVRVRLVNLPKKKNIHRDLKSAFQGIPGIIDIIPTVSGNKKTKDPVCKGFAFVDFKHEEDATRFIQLYSTQTITFGKVQKQIRCEMLNSQSQSSSCRQPSGAGDAAPRLQFLGSEQTVDNLYVDTPATDSESVINSSDSDGLGGEISIVESEEIDENPDFSTDTRLSNVDTETSNIIKEQQMSKANVEKVPQRKFRAKEKLKKVPKLDIPGSSRRLKVKEKSVLKDVFSRYGLKAAAEAE